LCKIRVVVLGDLLYDCFAWADRLPRMGETVTGYQNGFFSGGKGANQAVQAARLGAETYMLGKVGADERGEFLLRSLEENGVNTDFVLVDKTISTGTCCVHVDSSGNNAIIVVPLANEHIRPDELEQAQSVIQQADVFITQLQLNEDVIGAALTISHNAGVTTVFNPAPAKSIPDYFFKLADYITPNETETEFFTGLSRTRIPLEQWCKEAAAIFHSKGARQCIITLGEHGAFYGGKEQFFVPPFKVDAVDSTAAGDSFNAAFAIAQARGVPIYDSILIGNGAGALTASRMGSQPSLPTKRELASFLETNKLNNHDIISS
jgi:ribokinase